jgi:hypothetical protein
MNYLCRSSKRESSNTYLIVMGRNYFMTIRWFKEKYCLPRLSTQDIPKGSSQSYCLDFGYHYTQYYAVEFKGKIHSCTVRCVPRAWVLWRFPFLLSREQCVRITGSVRLRYIVRGDFGETNESIRLRPSACSSSLERNNYHTKESARASLFFMSWASNLVSIRSISDVQSTIYFFYVD